MQLYRLTFRGLGPFKDEQTIDFRRLAESPLFLLEGPTGSGKSTIIDALVFALYGGVAGSDADDDRLVSQYLPEGVEPFVELVFSTNAGTFRVRRTPKYERPKARSAGTRTVNATAKLWRLGSPDAEAEGEPLATRPTEVGPEISRAIGLTKSQFIGTVILPQGEFAAFLKAHVRDRQAILQRIFRTDQYEALQRRLRDQKRQAEAQIDDANEAVGRAAARFTLAAGIDAGWEPPTDADERVVAADGIIAELDARVADCLSARTAREAENKAARDTLAEMRDKARRRDRKAQALARKARVEGDRPEQSRRVARLEAHDRAARVKGALDGAVQAETRLNDAKATEDQRRQAVPDEVRDMDSAALAAHADALAQEVTRLEPLVSLESTLGNRAHEIEAAQERLATLTTELADVAAALEAIPGRRTDLGARRDEAQRHAAVVDDARRRVETLAQQLTAAQSLVQARDTQAAAARHLDEAVAAAAKADAERYRLQQAHYAGMAAELATELTDGDPCPVCGAVEHPNPAVQGDDHVTKAAVQAAEKRHRAADRDVTTAREAKHAIDTEVEGLRVRADGKEVSVLVAEDGEARARLAQAEAAVRDAKQYTADLAALDKEHQAYEERRSLLAAEHARLETSIDTNQRRLDDDRTTVAKARGTADSVADRSDATEQRRRHVEALTEAVRVAEQAQADATRRQEELTDALSQERFADASEATSALLARQEQSSLEAAVRAFRDEDAAVAAILAEPELAGVDHEETIDLDGAVKADEEAADALKQAVEAASRASEKADETRRCADDLHAAADSRDELVTRSEPVILLGRIVQGERSRLSMTLATYVLRQRFRSVVAAANHHLQRMSDGALTLEATDEAADGRQLAGLGLRVIDLRTGDKARGTGTLSGGETFYTALSLALGLAGVVTAEAGGLRMDTLFVDEGFGSLDPEVLDDVLSVLTGLHEHGRVVGVVSHVEELKARIPDRIEVRRSQQNGPSTLTLTA